MVVTPALVVTDVITHVTTTFSIDCDYPGYVASYDPFDFVTVVPPTPAVTLRWTVGHVVVIYV